jgi:hypothetical protein
VLGAREREVTFGECWRKGKNKRGKKQNPNNNKRRHKGKKGGSFTGQGTRDISMIIFSESAIGTFHVSQWRLSLTRTKLYHQLQRKL